MNKFEKNSTITLFSNPLNVLGKAFSSLLHTPSSTKPRRRIALLLNHIENPWEGALHTSLCGMLPTIFNAQFAAELEVISPLNNQKLMHNNIAWHFNKSASKYDAIISMGVWMARSIERLQGHWRKKVPHIFVGVDNPEYHGFVQDENTNKHLIGVKTVFPDYRNQIQTLLDLRPSAKKVVIPHNIHMPRGREDIPYKSEVELLTEAFINHGLEVVTLPITHDTPLHKALQPYTDSTHIVCTPNDSVITVQHEAITHLCEQYGITYFSSDVMSIQRGAAVGFGTSGSSYVSAISYLLHHILNEGHTPNTLPLLEVAESAEVRYNEYHMKKQGIELTEKEWRFLKMRSIYARD